MRVAVLMSTYNGEKYLKQQIDSILNQKGDFEIELWVRDDGSTDATKDILDTYKESGKLNWYSGANLKPAKSFMELLFRCGRYDYYAFADQDDFWLDDKLKHAVQSLDGMKDPAVYCSNARLVDSNLAELGRNVYKKRPHVDFYTVISAPNILGCTMVMNEALVHILTSREFPDKIIMHDAYVSGVCSAIDGKIVYENESLLLYRQHRHNVVGVAHTFLGKIKQRTNTIFQRKVCSVAHEAEEILRIYGDLMPDSKREWVEKIANYNKNILNRIFLAMSRKTKYISKNISLRLAILLGNR